MECTLFSVNHAAALCGSETVRETKIYSVNNKNNILCGPARRECDFFMGE